MLLIDQPSSKSNGMNDPYLKKNILLVEDRVSNIDLILEASENIQIPYNLHIVQDGEEATDFVYRKGDYSHTPRPDLILLDLNLPKMNGHEFLALIKQDPKLKLIPIVVLTTSTCARDIIESYALNANCYVNKPSDIKQFFRVIQLIFDFWLTSVTLPPTS